MTALHHVAEGPAEGPVLVMVPSLGTDLGLFDPQVAAFADRYRVVRVDLPGHGGSPTPPGPYAMTGLAADVLAVLDGLGVGRFDYLGVSIGGAIGLQLALDHGDRMRSLTVCASSARFADPPSWPRRAATVRAEGTEAMLASRPGTWFTHGFAAAEPATAAWLLAMLGDTDDEGYAGCSEAIGAFDLHDRLGAIAVPTLAIAGAEDPATPPAMLRHIADSVPDGRYVEVPDAAHLLNVEHPEVVVAELTAHLAG